MAVHVEVGSGGEEAVAQFGIGGIDGPLGGGLRRGIVADVYGPPASGKTQLAYRACASAASAGRRVLFVDAKGEFRPERVLEMARGLGAAGAAGPGRLLDRIAVFRVAGTAEQMRAVDRMAGFDLAIVDGLTDLFTFEFDLREQRRPPARRRGAARHRQFSMYARSLSAAASREGAAVLATNSVRSAGDGTGRWVESLGAAVSLLAHARMRLDPGAGPDSGWTSGSLATLGALSRFAFRITDTGLEERDPSLPPVLCEGGGREPGAGPPGSAGPAARLPHAATSARPPLPAAARPPSPP